MSKKKIFDFIKKNLKIKTDCSDCSNIKVELLLNNPKTDEQEVISTQQINLVHLTDPHRIFD